MGRSMTFKKVLKKNRIACKTADTINRGKLIYPYGAGWIRAVLRDIRHWIYAYVLKRNMYPVELQLPITYNCNFNCIMCGMEKNKGKKNYSAKELSQILKNPLYQKIRSVGIGGGEPFLRADLDECISVLIHVLPKLKSISIISNGYFTDSICKKLKIVKHLCKKHDITLQFSISIDGVNEIQDYMRGLEGAYLQAEKTLNLILADKEAYCDSLKIICTITSKNIERINELDTWAKQTKVPISYNVATVSERLRNVERVSNFSLSEDREARLLAAEFFLKKYYETKNDSYWALYAYLYYRERYSYCIYQNGLGVVLAPNAKLSYCATHSKEIGNSLEEASDSLFFGNMDYRRQLFQTYCKTCSQYTLGLNRKGYERRIKELWIRGI